MPYSIVHTELAFQTKKPLFEKKSDFLLYIIGSIFVDSNYILSNTWFHIHRKHTHYYKDGEYEDVNFPEVFWHQEWIKDNPFMAGYYFHLVTDQVWRDSSLIQKAYQSREFERWYQISRKIHSFYDLQKLLWDTEKIWIIDESSKLDFSSIILPSVFKDIPYETLKKTYDKMLDYMMWKDFFLKNSESGDDYTIVRWTLHIKDKELEKHVLTLFPYNEYQGLKNIALDKFQSEVLPKIC
jgi:hypothetical protein